MKEGLYTQVVSIQDGESGFDVESLNVSRNNRKNCLIMYVNDQHTHKHTHSYTHTHTQEHDPSVSKRESKHIIPPCGSCPFVMVLLGCCILCRHPCCYFKWAASAAYILALKTKL